MYLLSSNVPVTLTNVPFILLLEEAKIELVTQYTRKGTVKGNEYSFDRIEFNFENRSSSGLIKLSNNKYNLKLHVAKLY